MSLFSTNGNFRSHQGPSTSLRGSAGRSKSLLGGEEPFTLVHNLRTRPLAFVVACLGLMGVLALKVVLTRAEAPTKSGSR